MSDFSFRQLEIFLDIVDQGSFTKCADHHGITPIAISNHIKRLEHSLGYPLFKRIPGESVILTERGEQAYQRVQAAFRELERIRDPHGLLGQDKLYPLLRLAADPYVYSLMAGGLKELAHAYPGLEIVSEMRAVSEHEIANAINQNQIDIGLFLTFGQAATSARFVCDIPTAAYVGEHHPLAEKTFVTPQDLDAIPTITRPKGFYANALWDRALASIGVSHRPAAVKTDSFGLILESLHRNQGFICMFQGQEKIANHDVGIKPLALKPPLPSLSLYLAVRQPIENDDFIQHVISLLSHSIVSRCS